MNEAVKTVIRILPSATPNEADITAWSILPRDEQLLRLREALAHPDCARSSGATMPEVLEQARSAAKSRNV